MSVVVSLCLDAQKRSKRVLGTAVWEGLPRLPHTLKDEHMYERTSTEDSLRINSNFPAGVGRRLHDVRSKRWEREYLFIFKIFDMVYFLAQAFVQFSATSWIQKRLLQDWLTHL